MATLLWRQWLATAGSGLGSGGADIQKKKVTTTTDTLGKPSLIGVPPPVPAVSFSYGSGRLWAALGGFESGLGLDAASPQEFAGEYPWRRFCHAREMREAHELAGTSWPEVAALLWSVKEAVVKTLGCAFHFFGPRQLWVRPAGTGSQGLLWRVFLMGAAGNWHPAGRVGGIRAASFSQDSAWLSLAVGPCAKFPAHLMRA